MTDLGNPDNVASWAETYDAMAAMAAMAAERYDAMAALELP